MKELTFAKFDFINDLDVDQNVSLKLSQQLVMILNGRSDAILSPIAKEHGPSLLLSEFNKVFDAGKSKLNDVLLNLEYSNKDKFGPRSIAVPWIDRKSSLLESFNSSKRDRAKTISLSPGDNRLRPISKEKASELLKNSTNSGLPYLTKKGIIKDRVLNKYDLLLARKDPCVLFTRTTEQGKTRNVWGYPMVDTLNEMCYYSPLLEYQKKLNYRAALRGPDEVSRCLTDLIIRSIKLKHSILSIDFSAYDTSVKSKLQDEAFKYINSLFQTSYLPDLEYIAYRFKTIGIVTPDGILKGEHGVPSGSTFTNEVDSVVQKLVSESITGLDENLVQIQGDDGVYSAKTEIIEELKEKFISVGLSVNEEKSYLSNNYAIYLQLLFHIDYLNNGIIGGIYPVYRALNRILYQERWSNFEDFEIEGKDYYAIRTICILENCKYHPLFEALVTFIYKYDKYSLEFSELGLSNYIQMINKTSGAGEILNHQYGDNVGGIRSFETYKMIQRLG